MIDPKAVTTFAQYNEDIILEALLTGIKQGFYVDVGANYPVVDSVTEFFYQKGWRGINVEPINSLYKQLVKERPKDINLNIGISDKNGRATFREFAETPGHSTFDLTQKKLRGKTQKFKDYQVPIKTLKEVLNEHKPKHIHFMKIDAEGLEYQIVSGNDWEKYRPEVICIEANHISQDWRPILTKHNYKLYIKDGLNEYYVAQEHWQRTKGFAERVVGLDYRALKQHQQQSWQSDSKDLIKLNKVVQEQHKQIQAMNDIKKRLEHETALSLRNRPWLSRFKRAVYGLTVDWVRYKKTSKNSK